MRTVGIIAEYNPIHTGHAYQLEKAKELAGADYALVVMSPDYVQRGEPAVFDKYTRALTALEAGADLVVELPVCYACGSAEYFAEGAVRLLDALGVVDALCFGAEHADAAATAELASILNGEPEVYRAVLKENLRSGFSFPQARFEALAAYLRSEGRTDEEIASMTGLISSPNNILGVEYARAIQKFDSKMQLLPLQREGASYNSPSLEDGYSSANAIRTALLGAEDPGKTLSDQLLPFIPSGCLKLYREAIPKMVCPDDLLPYLNRALLYRERFDDVLDVSEDLSKRIGSLKNSFIGKSFAEIVSALKSRQFTETRIRRALLHIILDIGQKDTDDFRAAGTVFYAHFLGFRESAAPLLHGIKEKSALPLISKAAQAPGILTGPGLAMWEQNVRASDLYSSLVSSKSAASFRSEYEHSPAVLKF